MLSSASVIAVLIVSALTIFVVNEVGKFVQETMKDIRNIVSILPARGWGLIAVCIIGVVLYALPRFLTWAILLGILGLAVLVTTLWRWYYLKRLPWKCAWVIVGEFAFGCVLNVFAFRGWLLLHPGDVLWIEGVVGVAMPATLALCWLLVP